MQRGATAARLLRARGKAVVLATHPSRRELQALQHDDTIIACGGDGTVHAALQWAMRLGVNLAVLPAGHGNDIARSLGVADWTVDAHVARWLAEPVSIDVGYLPDRDEWFLGVLAAGFDARVNERANRMSGTGRYVRALFAELPGMSPIPYRIEIDGQRIDARGLLLCIGNGGFYGAGMSICPDADLTDGLFDIVFVQALRRIRFLALFGTVYRGTHVQRPEVLSLRGASVTIDAPDHMGYADGEPIGQLPLHVVVQPAALGSFPANP